MSLVDHVVWKCHELNRAVRFGSEADRSSSLSLDLLTAGQRVHGFGLREAADILYSKALCFARQAVDLHSASALYGLDEYQSRLEKASWYSEFAIRSCEFISPEELTDDPDIFLQAPFADPFGRVRDHAHLALEALRWIRDSRHGRGQNHVLYSCWHPTALYHVPVPDPPASFIWNIGSQAVTVPEDVAQRCNHFRRCIWEMNILLRRPLREVWEVMKGFSDLERRLVRIILFQAMIPSFCLPSSRSDA